jgi:O-antigen/teichoic acid export membrane protein
MNKLNLTQFDETSISKSFGGRFAISFLANLSRSIITLVTTLLLARWLGPSDYGRMMFLLTSFIAVKQLFDMASSSAFFTFLSQKMRSKRFVIIFWIWIVIQFTVIFSILVFFLPTTVVELAWNNETRLLVLLALTAAFMQNSVWPVAAQMAESARETINLQKINVITTFFHLVVVILLWLYGKLVIPLILLTIAIEWLLASILTVRLYKVKKTYNSRSYINLRYTRLIIRKFCSYCLPLIPYAWLSFFHDFGDRWMLQKWGGSIEQAYYSVSHQISAIALLATVSILRIFWKEIAEAQYNKNFKRVERLYFQVTVGLYFLGASIAGIMIPWSQEIMFIFLGGDYVNGYLTFSIMLLYPLHQSMGQIGGSMLHATENTKLQFYLGSIFLVSSLSISFYMLAPENFVIPGLGMGSNGLALKMVITQLMYVNILHWFISRVFKWRFRWYYQIYLIIITCVLGYTSKYLSEILFEDHLFLKMSFSLLLYVSFLFCLIIYNTKIIAQDKDFLILYLKKIRSILTEKNT